MSVLSFPSATVPTVTPGTLRHIEQALAERDEVRLQALDGHDRYALALFLTLACDAYGLTVEEGLQPRKDRPRNLARRLFILLAFFAPRKRWDGEPRICCEDVAAIVGRDHTTCLYARNEALLWLTSGTGPAYVQEFRKRTAGVLQRLTGLGYRRPVAANGWCLPSEDREAFGPLAEAAAA